MNMFLKKEITLKSKAGKTLKVLWYFICDNCNASFERTSGQNGGHMSNRTNHFCCNDCKFKAAKKGNVLHEKSLKTNLERYGNMNPQKTDIVRQHCTNTFKERYGESVTTAMHIPGVKERRKRTFLEKYGVEDTFQSPVFLEKRRKTWLKKYGTENPLMRQSVLEKIHEGWVKNPRGWTSKLETSFYEMLCRYFGCHDVFRQKKVVKWPIDFYIESIDTYIQFDGVYWHALDVDIDALKESQSPRDRSRYLRYLNDQKQNEWFTEKGLKLVRITDKQFKELDEAIINFFLSDLSAYSHVSRTSYHFLKKEYPLNAQDS